MPKLEPKIVQRELDQGQIWPVYWLYGPERMKSRELVKRIRKAALGDAEDPMASLLGMAEETLDGGETDVASIVDAAMSPSLGGGTRFIIVRDAHLLKNAEEIEPLLAESGAKAKPMAKADLASVCVFLSKDLDARKKSSKLLIERAAVVACEEVLEADRAAWVSYLAKRKGLELTEALGIQLATIEPWSLDIIDQELEKLELSKDVDTVLAGGTLQGGADAFFEAFFSRDLREALARADSFARQPDEALPLLGLFAWNVRHLVLLSSSRGSVRLSPYIAEKLGRWGRGWSLADLLRLQSRLAELDFGTKQTPLLPIGLWAELVEEFCDN